MEFVLRDWKNSDLESLVKFANNAKIAGNLTNKFNYPYSKNDGQLFIEMAKSHSPIQVFAIAIDDVAVGGIGIHKQDDVYCKNMEMGYWLAEPYWGNGIVTRAIQKVVKYGFETFDITRIFARPYGPNRASQRVLEKAGFTLEARIEKSFYKNDEFLDELIYGVRKD